LTHPTLRLKRAYLAMRRSIDVAIKPFGFSAAQFDVIQLLLHDGPLEHRQLQERLAMTSPTLTNILDGMVSAGFVARTVDSHDARVRRITLGDATRAICADPAFQMTGDRLVARMFKGLSEAERSQVLASLDRIAMNLRDD
jgi:DNA-binding MarR family transcriptional regulator